MERLTSENIFTLKYYKNIIETALNRGYTFKTLQAFYEERSAGATERSFVLRHDLDAVPSRLEQMIEVELECGVTSSVFVLVRAAHYNVFSHEIHRVLTRCIAHGIEIGLHSNFLETAMILEKEPIDILAAEANILCSEYESVSGIACHRTLDFMFNSLPYLQKNWSEIQQRTGLQYDAYCDTIISDSIYVNEGFNPHLGWRDVTPERAIETGNDIIMLTHPHWWHRAHIYEGAY